jgi:hypothetical protein
MVTETKTSSSYAITSQELSYLLALVGANGLTGVDHPHLTPGADGDAVYGAGRAWLEARGWLSQQAGRASHRLDDVMQEVALTLAYPTHLIAVLMPHRLLQYYVSERHTLRLTSPDRDAFDVAPMASPRDCGADIVDFCGLGQGDVTVTLLVMRVSEQRITASRQADLSTDAGGVVFKVGDVQKTVPADAALGDRVTALIAELMRALPS